MQCRDWVILTVYFRNLLLRFLFEYQQCALIQIHNEFRYLFHSSYLNNQMVEYDFYWLQRTGVTQIGSYILVLICHVSVHNTFQQIRQITEIYLDWRGSGSSHPHLSIPHLFPSHWTITMDFQHFHLTSSNVPELSKVQFSSDETPFCLFIICSEEELNRMQIPIKKYWSNYILYIKSNF